MNGCATVPGFEPQEVEETLNRWIAHETGAGRRARSPQAIEAYKFNDAAGAVYRFVWNIYLRLVSRTREAGAARAPTVPAKTETRAMVAWVRDEILELLHPFMPFITEELWAVTAEGGPPRDGLLALAPWPHARRSRGRGGRGRDRLGGRSRHRHPLGACRDEHPAGDRRFRWCWPARPPRTRRARGRWTEVIKRLARLADISFADAPPPGAVQLLVRGEIAALPLKGVIDLAAERARLEKEMAKVEADIARIDAKLGNADFVARAPEEVVEGEREKREEAVDRKARSLRRWSGCGRWSEGRYPVNDLGLRQARPESHELEGGKER